MIPANSSYPTTQTDTDVQIYGDAYLGYAGSLPLPTFTVGSTSYAGHSRYVFWNKAENGFVVAEQADSTAQLASDYGVAVYSLTTPAAGCSFSLPATSARFDASGGFGSASVQTGAACIWQAISNVPWITVTAGDAGFGVNSAGYSVSANPSTARTGTLTIGGQTFTVTQAGSSRAGGSAKVGVFRGGFLWILDQNGNHQFDSPPDLVYPFGGIAGDIPITGDWNGSGTTKIGIYRSSNGLFLLDYNGNGQLDAADRIFSLGIGTQPGDIPVTGDWNGDGRTKVGIFRGGFFWILDTNGDYTYEAGADSAFAFGGAAGDIPVVGDWNGNGISKVGVFRQGYLWILDTNGDHAYDAGDQVFAFGGVRGDLPVVGDWNGDGRTKVGVFRSGFLWVLDSNGNQTFDSGDQAFAFGGVTGDKPVVGKW